ncbi:O-antigen ligase family protein [Meiothermus ruber]|uniref:O-antigen ligase family protein n=1 Tax=Meiothermus ruber TaxID=277 RepID=UPI001FCBD6F4|nr:O-antigen ligase family protein [Meiothermus ruber]
MALVLPKIPLALWAWWGLGLLTVFWSLTPGNTLVLGLWELAYLAAFAAGTWLAGLVGLNIALLGYGLLTTLTLAWMGLVMYFSGSSHYVAGAQALVLIPLAMMWLFRSRWPILSGILLTGALYLALMSGARAVYLPLVFIVLLMVWRLWREGIPLRQIMLVCALVAAAIVSLDTALPFSPIQNALGLKATLSRQAQDLGAEGSIGSRLQMWDQTLKIALQHPMGTGNGSFRDTLAAYLQYPGILFSNAHNYYLETAATGGWLRLLLLLVILVWALWHGWNSPAWPWALGAAGLWTTLAFDVTGMYPSVMMLAFASLGAVHSQIKIPLVSAGSRSIRFGWMVSVAGLIATIGLAAWWYWPCKHNCAVSRYLGYRPAVLNELERIPEAQQNKLLSEAERLNPKSLWVYRIRLERARAPEEKMQLLQQIIEVFPLANPIYYLQLAELATDLNQPSKAIQVLELGLSRFPPDFKGYQSGNFFGALTPSYETWRTKAPELLERLK